MTEGRRALMERLTAIESGAECARWLPLLSALADGEATAAQLADLRPHLRSCPACRAALRGFHAAPANVAALVPVGLLPLAAAPGDSLLGHATLALHGLAERATLLASRTQGAFEALPGAKLAAVAASTAAIAGGGAALEHATGASPPPRAATRVADAGAMPSPGLRLMTIRSPLRPTRPSGQGSTGSRTRGRGEFASAPASAAEFVPGSAPTAEFAAAPAPQGAAAAAAPSASPSRAPAGASEFASP